MTWGDQDGVVCFLSQLGAVSSDTKDWYKTHGGKEVRKDARMELDGFGPNRFSKTAKCFWKAWDETWNQILFRDLLLASFGWCSSCKDAKIPCLAGHGFAGNAESQCSVICRALSPGVCWRNHWALAENLMNLSVMSMSGCLFMFFYHSSQLIHEFELESENRNLTYRSGPLQPRRASYAWLVAGAQDVRSPNRSNPWDMARSWDQSVQGPKWRRRPQFLGKSPSHTLIESLNSWAEFGFRSFQHIDQHIQKPDVASKKVTRSQGATLSF